MSKNLINEQTTDVSLVTNSVPDFLRGKTTGGRGMEDVTASDIIIPRVELIQALSPVRDKKDPTYIDGAEEGMMYNNVTRALYGTEVTVVPVVYRKQWLVWKDRKLGGGANGFRGAFATELEAKKHIAELNEEGLVSTETAQHFCLIIQGAAIDEAVVSMSKTKLKVSKRWNSLMRMAGGDCFERAYKLAPTVEVNARNEKYYNFNVTQTGYVNRQVYVKAEALYEQVTQGSVVVSQDFSESSAPIENGEF